MWVDKMTVQDLESLFISAGLMKPRPTRTLEEIQDMRETVDHARNCAECAALLGITDFLPQEPAAIASQAGSTVVNMQEWLQRKSRGKLAG